MPSQDTEFPGVPLGAAPAAKIPAFLKQPGCFGLRDSEQEGDKPRIGLTVWWQPAERSQDGFVGRVKVAAMGAIYSVQVE